MAGTELVISITVTNNGMVHWNSPTGLSLDAFPTDAQLFSPQKIPLPEGVTVGPGQSFTYPSFQPLSSYRTVCFFRETIRNSLSSSYQQEKNRTVPVDLVFIYPGVTSGNCVTIRFTIVFTERVTNPNIPILNISVVPILNNP
jgi:hypothetical protein